ncbi:hypothetical protein [Rhodanobacter sp. BL-MT-08]
MAEPLFSHAPAAFGEALDYAFEDALVLDGAASNVASHLAALGMGSRMITRMGDDESGQQLRATVARCGLRPRGSQPDGRTARVGVREHAGGYVLFISMHQAFDCIDAEAAVATVLNGHHCVDHDWLCSGTLVLRGAAGRDALETALKTGGRKTFPCGCSAQDRSNAPRHSRASTAASA